MYSFFYIGERTHQALDLIKREEVYRTAQLGVALIVDKFLGTARIFCFALLHDGLSTLPQLMTSKNYFGGLYV